MQKQITQLHLCALENEGAGTFITPKIQADKQGSTFVSWLERMYTHTRTLWSHSKYISTWTSIQLPCLCNVSFTEPGPLANSRPDPVFISGWKDGVEEHPPSGKQRVNTHQALISRKSHKTFQHTYIYTDRPTNVFVFSSNVRVGAEWGIGGVIREGIAEIKKHPHMESM